MCSYEKKEGLLVLGIRMSYRIPWRPIYVVTKVPNRYGERICLSMSLLSECHLHLVTITKCIQAREVAFD